MFQRALRSVPGSGEVWARYIRFLVTQFIHILGFTLDMCLIQERTSEGDETMDGRESISGL